MTPVHKHEGSGRFFSRLRSDDRYETPNETEAASRNRALAAISRTLNEARARFEECVPESRPESPPGSAVYGPGRYWATQLATATGQMASAVALLPAAVGWMPSFVYSLCPAQAVRRSSQ